MTYSYLLEMWGFVLTAVDKVTSFGKSGVLHLRSHDQGSRVTSEPGSEHSLVPDRSLPSSAVTDAEMTEWTEQSCCREFSCAHREDPEDNRISSGRFWAYGCFGKALWDMPGTRRY